ncbi:MAG: DUF4091 domain-containing protein [Bacteroidales bacterium]
MRNLIPLSLYFILPVSLVAQANDGVTQCGRPTGQASMPLIEYTELENHLPADIALWKKCPADRPLAGWGSTDKRYAQEQPALELLKSGKSLRLNAWKGERVNSQFVISSSEPLADIGYTLSDFVHVSDASQRFPAESISSGFVRYVMTDGPNEDGESACGCRLDHTKFDSTLVADPIDHHLRSIDIAPMTTRSLWFTVWVPQSAKAGKYQATLNVLGKEYPFVIDVSGRELPQPEDWTFHLDLWQNPFSIARYYGVDLWSKEHFEVMRPYAKRMKDAGIGVITTSIMHDPWNAQTEDLHQTMVTWMKKADGTWSFDYAMFDLYVQFMLDNGIDRQISCFSMIPWHLKFRYFDQATDSFKEINAQPGESEFNQVWSAMLTSFASHLKEKGWFDKTCISIDERPMDQVLEVIKLVQGVDPDFKLSYAGNYHEELAVSIYDYSVAQRQRYPEKIKQLRKDKGFVTTYYTCCAEAYPNVFTFSQPADGAWLPIHAAAEQIDGYLRWNLTHWVKEPLLDSRFKTWAAGDTYLLYPGCRSSIRYERMIEGVQTYEKINILRNEWQKRGETGKLKKLNRLLSQFNEQNVKLNGSAIYVNQLNKMLTEM